MIFTFLVQLVVIVLLYGSPGFMVAVIHSHLHNNDKFNYASTVIIFWPIILMVMLVYWFFVGLFALPNLIINIFKG